MTGRVIALPMANAPAARQGTRHSPIDGRSLNKSFPGSALGSPTRIIADYIERHLMPISDLVIDLHSDSRSIRLRAKRDVDLSSRRAGPASAFRCSAGLRRPEYSGLSGLRRTEHIRERRCGPEQFELRRRWEEMSRSR